MEVRRFTAIAILALVVIAILSACDQGTRRPVDTPAVLDTAQSAPTANGLPVDESSPSTSPGSGGVSGYTGVMNSDTIQVDGGLHRVRLAQIGDTLPFSTAYPVDEMEARIGKDGRGTGVRFLATFEGKPDDDAYVHIFIPAYTMSVDQIQDMVDAGLKDRGVQVQPIGGSGACPWADRSFRLADDQGYTGLACIGRHNGSAFYLLEFYPGRLANEMEARIDVIRKHFRWNDGTPLIAAR